MDRLDRQLLTLLTDDSRLPVASIAAATGTSRATVKARIDRLVARGVISRFTIDLGPEARNATVRAIVQIEVHGTQSDRVIEQLLNLNDIYAVHSTNGRWDLVAQLESRDLRSFDEALRLIRLIHGINQTESSLLLSSRYSSAKSFPGAGASGSSSLDLDE